MSTKFSVDSIAKKIGEEFKRDKPILSYSGFLELVLEHPELHTRTSAQYTKDCFEYFGTSQIDGFLGEFQRYNLFDAPFDEGRNSVIGHHRVQERVFNLVEAFVRQGRVNKLIVLHGPNGSAKSTFVDTIMRALEAYSKTDQGALYRFNWIFPNERKTTGAAIGFGGSRAVDPDQLETYAFLEAEQIDARLKGELNDHPLLLIPQKQREELLAPLIDSGLKVSEQLLYGDLSHSSRQIFDTLMGAYHGDFARVLKHIQVERLFFSRRYRVGLVTVEPQMRVDAGLRQVTMDRSAAQLPPVLQNLTLLEPLGDLPDANRGIIAYDDMFKRHPDLNKYLLGTSEKATVPLDNRILHLDSLLIATANEDYLEAYKQTPDYVSFKGRVELVRVPYILDYKLEAKIYDEHLKSVPDIRHVAPHTTYVAALWAVLTRLKRPKADLYPKSLRDVISQLSPLEKAELYAHGEVPDYVSPERSRELLRVVPELLDEGEGTADYEGRYGASPREMKMIMLSASQNPEFSYLSPLAVFEELEDLVKDPSVFPFLQMKPDGDYFRHDNFIQTVRERYLDLIDREILDALGLIESTQYDELFARYVDHVSQRLKGEKVLNRSTGQYEEPSEKFLGEVEELFGMEIEDEESFRESLISTIAAYSIDNPGEKVQLPLVFPGLFASMKRHFFEARQDTVARILKDIIKLTHEDDKLDAASEKAAREALERMCQKYNYREDSAQAAVAFLYSSRYKN